MRMSQDDEQIELVGGFARLSGEEIGATVTITRTHVTVSFANPHLTCDQCKQPVPAWHNPQGCGCGEKGWQNQPCGHQAGVTSTCPSWGPVDGCRCPDKHSAPPAAAL